MPINSGIGITDQIDMLDKMIEVVASSRHLASVVVNAGGTGHAIGDIIEIDATGSTSTIVAQLEVTSVSGGVIDGIRIFRSGAYTVDPTTTTANAQSGSSGAGINSTFDLTMSAAKWALNRRTQEAVSAAIGAGGTGYSVSDQLTLVINDGVQGNAGADAIFNVDTESAGVVTAVSIVAGSEGNYEEIPSNDVAVTGGGGTGCTLTVTWGDPPQTRQDEQVAMLQGEGLGGTDAIHIMVRTYTRSATPNDAYNWQLLGATGYNSTLPIHQQPGVDPLQIIASTGTLPFTDIGAYFVLKNNDANPDISWWMNWNGRRIILVCKVESATTTFYTSMFMGFLDQLATAAEYPYPMWICGTTNDRNRTWFDASNLMGGIVEVIYLGSADPTGPGYIRKPDGSWKGHAGETSTSGSVRSVETEFGIFPFFNPAILTGANITSSINSDVDWSGGAHDIIPSTGVPGVENILFKPTPGTGSDFYWLVKPLVVRQETGGAGFPTQHEAYGEIPGVFWFSRGNNVVVSEDRFELGTKRYLIFQCGNRTQNWSYFAFDED